MHESYADIRGRIAEPPQWWDEFAVPRYTAFRPDLCANIYAAEAALVEIACQDCATRFLVAMSNFRGVRPLAERIRDGSLHYGDPPNIGCCAAGPTMNCDDLRVLQYWRRPGLDWERDPALEVPLTEEAR